ncbi:hypothetical protein BDEG_21334 [Batrachochytrium dendrobatidis JEL423]|uniref:Uncharacterized protein n=1 Tax=Batrachochytrium dendrobatidis (strain JEL423) TaxID=403673 RepID=A0A177WC79_BATDL|nr:hypothetical protein BDEG_21334 [Batrachochytrium dendrobatidis JEL423]
MISKERSRRAIVDMPSILEYLGFLYFFPAFLIGPAFSFVEYNNYLHRRGEFKTIPNPYVPAMECLSSTFIPLFIVIQGSPHFSPSRLLDSVLLQEKTFLQLCVFYIAWKLSETACIYTGFGFNGYNENGYATWDRVDNCDMVRIELAGNIRELVSVWNMQTAVWLKRDVYGRLTDLGFDKQTATTITFFISAFWHGVHIGYYITFMSGSVVTIIARHIRRHIRPIFANEHSLWHWLKPVYDVTGIVTTQLTTVYIVIPFLVRDIWQCFLIYRALYFFVHVGIVVLYVAFETKLGRAGLAHMGISVNDPIKFETTSESGPVTDPVKAVRQKNC